MSVLFFLFFFFFFGFIQRVIWSLLFIECNELSRTRQRECDELYYYYFIDKEMCDFVFLSFSSASPRNTLTSLSDRYSFDIL